MTPTAVGRQRQVLDRFLNPVRDALTPEVAKAIADLRADPATQQLIEDLSDRHHEGKLNPDELADYEALVSATNVIAVLQAKARSVLDQTKSP
jgi:hypothetical protein